MEPRNDNYANMTVKLEFEATTIFKEQATYIKLYYD